ncbi:potassium-transporting ATPase subunit KdpA [Arcanobacterium bovis]|uniref:Potassium-transporting ATPase potassium-binding subunit n=1 Tax=Arcanobacterium bovis TaxID=2529275 RepID=A0A4Q9UYT9_9ACTO|nr:potassium-transporting ATPase subunit KdpA [Arcanobacterium bovis]TBW20859.1 potassium-transporting ATPase subunit KdpA [Arcanobacterium bovis]
MSGYVPYLVVFAMLAAVYVPLGNYMAYVFTSKEHWRVERVFYRVVGVNAQQSVGWRSYAQSVVAFSIVCVVALYAIIRLQIFLPWHFDVPSMRPDQAWNTAVSFVTNTNWQSYSGETAMTFFSQMFGLAVQNFLSAGVGICVAIALIRSLADTQGRGEIGNFWVDLTRCVIRILLPIAALATVLLISQGVIQNLHAPISYHSFSSDATQMLPGGPVASQEAIKELGTNGGGFFNANSSHPFENPTMYTNMLEILLILVIPVCLTRTFGVMAHHKAQGSAVLGVMASIFAASLAVVCYAESHIGAVAGSGLEGKELRFGVAPSSLFAVATTSTSTGAIDSAHSSFSPIGGGMLTLNMMLGELSPGGVGTGMYTMLIMFVLSVFIAGLMVGRTPEFMGKRIQVPEITLVSLFILVMPVLVIAGVGISTVIPGIRDALSTSGPHGFSELVYAFTSASNNNGSAFAGIHADAPWLTISLAVAMFLGRFLPIIFALALAGRFSRAASIPETAGTLPTHRPLFIAVVVGICLIVGALTFLPTLVLGPIAEALL